MNPISKDQDAQIAGSFFYSFTNPVMENPVSTKIISVPDLWKFFNLSASLFCIAGTDGFFKHINPSFSRILGFDEQFLLSTSWAELVHPEDKAGAASQLDLLASQQAVSLCCRFRTARGDYRWLTWTITYPDNDGLIYASAQDCTDRYEIQEQLVQERIAKERNILEATVYGQEIEKAEIGRELHDNINQMLSTVKLYHELALAETHSCERFIPKATEILVAAIEETRMLSKSLVAPGVTEISLTDSINDLIATITHSKKIKIIFTAYRNNEDLPGKVKIALFRIVQEQLNNILKHARAEKVKIKLMKNLKILKLVVQDDGVGFDLFQKKSGIGLTNISSRARCFDGAMQIDSKPGAGCVLTVTMPLERILLNQPGQTTHYE